MTDRPPPLRSPPRPVFSALGPRSAAPQSGPLLAPKRFFGKRITVCVTGSVAAYKAVLLVRTLLKDGAIVDSGAIDNAVPRQLGIVLMEFWRSLQVQRANRNTFLLAEQSLSLAPCDRLLLRMSERATANRGCRSFILGAEAMCTAPNWTP